VTHSWKRIHERKLPNVHYKLRRIKRKEKGKNVPRLSVKCSQVPKRGSRLAKCRNQGKTKKGEGARNTDVGPTKKRDQGQKTRQEWRGHQGSRWEREPGVELEVKVFQKPNRAPKVLQKKRGRRIPRDEVSRRACGERNNFVGEAVCRDCECGTPRGRKCDISKKNVHEEGCDEEKYKKEKQNSVAVLAF